MTDPADRIRDLVLEHFPPELDAVWLGDDIPPRKARNARRSHNLDEACELLLLYDDTLFGGASDGLVITTDRLSFKELLDNPRSVRWTDITPDEIEHEGAMVRIGGMQVQFPSWTPEHAASVMRFLKAAAEHQRWPTGWNPTALIATVRQHLGHDADAYFAPSIPPRKLTNARALYGIEEPEPVLVLFDDTVFGSAKVGWAMTPLRWAFRQSFGEPGELSWADVSTGRLEADGVRIQCAGRSFEPLQSHRVSELYKTLEAIGALARDTLEPRNTELDARLRADPDDDDAVAVLTDWLLEIGHVRGEVGARQLSGSDSGFLLDDSQAIQLMPALPDGVTLQTRWRGGYWDALHLFAFNTVALTDAASPFDIARQVLHHPSAHYLRELHVGGDGPPGLHPDYVQPMLEALATASLPCLTSLTIHTPQGFVSDTLDLSAYPHLRQARLDASRVHPRVQHALDTLSLR